MNAAVLSAEVTRAVSRIKQLTDKKKLLGMYDKAAEYSKISDFEREVVIDAIDEQLRSISKLSDKKIPPKCALGYEFLSKIDEEMRRGFYLDESIVKAGVKSSGDMLKGTYYVALYISYKNPTSKWHIGISWIQENIDDQTPYLKVAKYQSSADKPGAESASYKMEEASSAIDHFKDAVKLHFKSK
jgi:hypothetical protein